MPREKLTLVHDAVLNACDALDGAKDGVLENPLACTFDPKVLACKQGADPASCLTDAAGRRPCRRCMPVRRNPTTGKQIFLGLERGSELGWNPVPVGYAVDYFKHIVFKDRELGSEGAQLRRARRAGGDGRQPDLRRERTPI